MHYKDGTPVKLGDVVKANYSLGTSLIGIVAAKLAESTTYLYVQPLAIVSDDLHGRQTTILSNYMPWTVTASECERLA